MTTFWNGNFFLIFFFSKTFVYTHNRMFSWKNNKNYFGQCSSLLIETFSLIIKQNINLKAHQQNYRDDGSSRSELP